MIPVAGPTFSELELAYVTEAVSSMWIAQGPFLEEFEKRFADYTESREALATNTGTAALHLALAALGIGPGDEVIVPVLSYIATANAVSYTGARPVFVDVLPGSWTIDESEIDKHLTDRTRAVIPVHLYGQPADAPSLSLYGINVVEDAAEAHGATLQGRPVGSLGDIAAFSFYGNKIVTTGEGGMVTTNDPELATRVRLLRGQGEEGGPYRHSVVGYNYRMSNLAAAIGVAQMLRLKERLECRRHIAQMYESLLQNKVTFQEVTDGRVPWMVVALFESESLRNRVAKRLSEFLIETRPVFPPLHTQKPYRVDRRFPVAEDIANRGLCLPTYAHMLDREVEWVCALIGGVV